MSAPHAHSAEPGQPPFRMPLTSSDLARIAASCPGETYMPPECGGDSLDVVSAWVTEAELTGRTDSYLGKRKYPRFTWNAIVLMRVRSGKLAGKVIRARSQNVSMGGMGIRLRSTLQAGTSVEIMVEGRPFGVTGTVAHCTKTLNGNLVGVTFG